ncbi:MAG: cupin domain-containing protein, partial [Alphaproteobacteria bacterium]
ALAAAGCPGPGGSAPDRLAVAGLRAPLRIVRPEHMAWQSSRYWDLKMLFHNEETGAHLILLAVPPGWTGALNHYHEWHEWAYILSGDLTNDEFVSPHQHRGARKQFREGDFLSRPPYSLHGVEAGGLASQVGCRLIIQEEGPSALTYGVVPGQKDFQTPDKAVTRWTSPRLIDTIGGMRWDDMDGMPGVKVKYLMDNDNFRARLHWVDAGFRGDGVPALSTPAYWPSGRRFRFVLYGDIAVDAYAAPGAPPQRFTATTQQLIDQGPRAIVALPAAAASNKGCVWLEVDYGDERGVVSDTAIAAPVPV